VRLIQRGKKNLSDTTTCAFLCAQHKGGRQNGRVFVAAAPQPVANRARNLLSGDETDRLLPTYYLLLLLLLLYRQVSNVYGYKVLCIETCKIEVASVAPTRVDGRENFYERIKFHR